jgi:hypothetical protein
MVMNNDTAPVMMGPLPSSVVREAVTFAAISLCQPILPMIMNYVPEPLLQRRQAVVET